MKCTMPTNLCWCQKTRVITLSRVCDRQDTITITKTALAQPHHAVRIYEFRCKCLWENDKSGTLSFTR